MITVIEIYADGYLTYQNNWKVLTNSVLHPFPFFAAL